MKKKMKINSKLYQNSDEMKTFFRNNKNKRKMRKIYTNYDKNVGNSVRKRREKCPKNCFQGFC